MPKCLYFLLAALLFISHPKNDLPDSERAKTIRTTVWPRLQKEMKTVGLKFSSPVYLRIFKEENLLEVWIKSGREYQLFKSYDICTYSGGLGTKTKSGDGKSPEGFYNITPKQLNPVSNYYLAINVGYPNKLEVMKGYTGNAIMIHGHCASIGCYAMTDPLIEEIYTIVYKALESGQQEVNLDIYPFRLNPQHMKTYSASPYMPFWRTMKPGYDWFEKTGTPPLVTIRGQQYVIKN